MHAILLNEYALFASSEYLSNTCNPDNVLLVEINIRTLLVAKSFI